MVRGIGIESQTKSVQERDDEADLYIDHRRPHSPPTRSASIDGHEAFGAADVIAAAR